MRPDSARDLQRHARSPVAALREIALVSQRQHQVVPRRRDLGDRPAGLARLARKAEAGERWNDEMEGVRRVRRVGQRLDDAHELQHRSGPAMRHDQRPRALVPRADVQEMDVQPVELDQEIGMGVERRLARAPVILLGPISREILHHGERNALVPVVDLLLVGPAGGADAGVEVVDRGLRHVDGEGAYLGHAARLDPAPGVLQLTIVSAIRPAARPIPCRRDWHIPGCRGDRPCLRPAPPGWNR